LFGERAGHSQSEKGSPMTQKTNPWTFDVRVRERNLKAGSLTEKDVEKYLSSLPDNAAQPALEQPEIADEADDLDDEDEGDVGGNDDVDTNGAPVGGGVGGGGGEGGV
jgi:hypothetical protein